MTSRSCFRSIFLVLCQFFLHHYLIVEVQNIPIISFQTGTLAPVMKCDVLYDNGERKATLYFKMGHFRGKIKRGRGWSGVHYNIITLDQNGGVVSKMITYSNLRGGYIVLVYYGHHYGYQVLNGSIQYQREITLLVNDSLTC